MGPFPFSLSLFLLCELIQSGGKKIPRLKMFARLISEEPFQKKQTKNNALPPKVPVKKGEKRIFLFKETPFFLSSCPVLNGQLLFIS